MEKKAVKILGCAALLIIAACGQTSQKEAVTETPEDWKTLDESGYFIQYPDTFEMDKSGQLGMSFILMSKQISQDDLFRENVNLLIQNLAGLNIDLDKFVEISEDQIKTMVTDGNLIESKRLNENNKEFQRLVYTGRQGQYYLKWQQFYLVENNRAYILTLTCEEDQYDKYLPVATEIMNTFTIK